MARLQERHTLLKKLRQEQERLRQALDAELLAKVSRMGFQIR